MEESNTPKHSDGYSHQANSEVPLVFSKFRPKSQKQPAQTDITPQQKEMNADLANNLEEFFKRKPKSNIYDK